MEMMIVAGMIAVIAAMSVPQIVASMRCVRARNDANSIQGLLVTARMRASMDFARTQVICYTTPTPNYCELQVAQFSSGNTPTSQTFVADSPAQRVYLSSGVIFDVPSGVAGVLGQSTLTPGVQAANITGTCNTSETNPAVMYSSRGWPLGPDCSIGYPGYALYLQDEPVNMWAAVGVDAGGRAYVYSWNGSTWVANQ